MAATVKVPAWPLTKLALLALLKVGSALTVRVKFWLALAPTLLEAPTVNFHSPPALAVGVPLSTPVVVLKPTPGGNAPVMLKVGAG